MKSDVKFDLEHAAWPAMLVDASGAILRANRAAQTQFGPALADESPPLAAIWAAENDLSAETFLTLAETSPGSPASFRFRGAGNSAATFTVLSGLYTKDDRRIFLLQLLPETTAITATKEGTGDVGLAHKQKLDCALQLARTVALDFNNALTSILGYTSLLLSKAEAAHPWRRTLLEVEKSAAKAAEVAADLAAFSRQEKEPRAQTAGNLNVILQRCIEFFQNAHKDAIIWNVQLERRIFAARFDETKIQQAFMKILENAVEALNENGRITIQTHNKELTEPTQDRNVKLAPGVYVCAEISDNGRGIEPDVLPRIFEPFFTTKRAPHRGLGLAWVYGIVTNHGGGVAVSSQPDVGTSVRLYLPAEENVVRDSTQASDDLTGNQTILMVDDEDLLLTMGETILSSYGYRVLTANSGSKALEIIAKGNPPVHLLITDLVMPGMSGRELVEQVRRLSPDTRVMCVSGYVWPGSQPEETTYLQKPFTTQELLMKVKFVLGPA